MKISIIGAGNVGGLTAMRLAQESLGEILLVDTLKGIARGKVFDLEDSRSILKLNYNIYGTEHIEEIRGSDIIVITAGFPRKPGMTREELLSKNSQIIKEICQNIKKFTDELRPSPREQGEPIVILVTNPLDLMTYLALKITGFKSQKVFGMGISLDAARFANLISKKLKIANTDVEACVIGTHGEGMLPLPKFTNVKGIALEEFLDDQNIKELVKKTIERGAEVVSLLGSGSAYFAPSAAIASIVKNIAKDEKRTIGVSAYLNGEYGIKDVCIGVPCRIGRNGIEEIIELNLNEQEKKAFLDSVDYLKKQFRNLPI